MASNEARKLALLNGETNYYTGIPCIRGHLAKRSTKSKQCQDCQKLTDRARYPSRYAKQASDPVIKARRREQKRACIYRSGKLPFPTREAGTRCECCNEEFSATPRLDHCHKEFKFRGWLCHKCNVGIGALGDNLAGVLKAVAYLEKANV